jgi:hypothetical protein
MYPRRDLLRLENEFGLLTVRDGGQRRIQHRRHSANSIDVFAPDGRLSTRQLFSQEPAHSRPWAVAVESMYAESSGLCRSLQIACCAA